MSISNLGVTNYGSVTFVDLTSAAEIQQLDIDGHPIFNLDLSQNVDLNKLSVRNCGLTSINISNSPLLTSINVEGNLLNNINIANRSNLWGINAASNCLTSLDTTGIPNLDYINVSNNPGISSIDISSNLSMDYLYASKCVALTGINLIPNWRIDYVDLSYCPLITSIDINELRSLDAIWLRGCSLTEFSPPGEGIAGGSRSDELVLIDVAYNYINDLDLYIGSNPPHGAGLEDAGHLDVSYNQLTSLRVEATAATEVTLIADNNPALESIVRVGSLNYFKTFWARDCNLQGILDFANYSGTAVLTTDVRVSNNNLTLVNILDTPSIRLGMTHLMVDNNNISTGIDISNMGGVNFKSLRLNDNSLSYITAAQFKGVNGECWWHNNNLDTDDIYNTLNQATIAEIPTEVTIYGNPAVNSGILQDGTLFTASQLQNLASAKNYTLKLTN